MLSLRLLRRSPGFTVAGGAILGLCIGINTAVFSLVNAVLLRPLPVRAPHELAFIYSGDREGRPGVGTRADIRDLAADTDVFAGVAASRESFAKLPQGADVDTVFSEEVSANYFDVLGVLPQLGRTLIPSVDDDPGAAPVVVISDAIWHRHFGAAPDVIGQAVPLPPTIDSLAGAPRYIVVGVMPPGFGGVASRLEPTEVWVLLAQRERESIFQRFSPSVSVAIARRRPGVARERAAAAVAVWQRRLDAASPSPFPRAALPRIIRDRPQVFLPFDQRHAIAPERLAAGLMAASAFVLLIGVANLCGLTMARGLVRRSESAIRVALGATGWRLARQSMAEGLLVAAVGGAIGLGLSRWLVVGIMDSMPNAVAIASFSRDVSVGVPIDWRVVMFTMFVVGIAGLLVGLAPLVHVWQANTIGGLCGQTEASSPSLRSRLRQWVVVPQIAVSLALLLIMGIALRAFLDVALVPPGYTPDRVAFAKLDLPLSPMITGTKEEKARLLPSRTQMLSRLLDAAGATPGIAAAALVDGLPLDANGRHMITRDDYVRHGSSRSTAVASVTPAYFDVLGIPLLAGRGFTSADLTATPSVVVVDASFAARHWPGQSPLGRQIAFYCGGPDAHCPPVPPTPPAHWFEVVGVVGAIHGPLSEGTPTPFVYTPEATPGAPFLNGTATMVVRGRDDDAGLVTTLRTLIAQADSSAVVLQVRMLDAAVDDVRYSRRVAARVTTSCGLIGLLLAAAGLYGMVSYGVAQRRKELGIRAALGADRRALMRLVLSEGARIAAIGAVPGFVLGVILIGLFSAQVTAIPRVDATTIVAAPLVLAIAALLASYVPARRAGRVDPMDVLRRP